MKRLLPHLSLVGVVLFASCSRQAPQATTTGLPTIRVVASAVHFESVPEFVALAGTVRPAERAQIAAKLSGMIEELNVTLGQAVGVGQVLGRISAAEVTARLRQAQAQLAQAERDLAREQELLAKNASPADLVKSLQDRVVLTRAIVSEAQTMQDYTVVRAPFAGVVAGKFVNSGDFATPGLPLLALEGNGGLQVEVAVPFNLVRLAEIGAVVSVELPDAGTSFSGKLAEVSGAVDPATRTVLVKINVAESSALRSGQFVRAQWPAGKLRALMLPASALTVLGQMERVFVVVDGKAQLRLVKTEYRRGDRVQIQAGLEPGEIVVLSPPATLRDGSPLEIAP